MAIASGILTIERLFDGKKSPPDYLFSLVKTPAFTPAFDMLWVTQQSDLQLIGFSGAQAATGSGQFGPAAVTLTLPDIGPADGHPHRISSFCFAPNGDMWVGYFDANPSVSGGQYLAKVSASKLVTSGAVTPDFSFPAVAAGVSTAGVSPQLITPAGDLWVTTTATTGAHGGLLFYSAASIASAGSPSPTRIISQAGIANVFNGCGLDSLGNMWFPNALAGTINRLSSSQLLSSNSAIVPDVVLTPGSILYSKLEIDADGNLWAGELNPVTGLPTGTIGLFLAADVQVSGSPTPALTISVANATGRVRFDAAGNPWEQTANGPNGYTPRDFAVGGTPVPRCTLRDSGLLTAASGMRFNPASFA